MDLLPPNLTNNCPKFVKDAICYSFRRSLNVKISFAQTVVLKNFFFPQAAKLWNLLPTDIQESKTFSAFVIKLKKYLRHHSFFKLYSWAARLARKREFRVRRLLAPLSMMLILL